MCVGGGELLMTEEKTTDSTTAELLLKMGY